MKRTKTLAFFLLLSAFQSVLYAQLDRIPLPPDGGNKKASVGEQIGLVKIGITYNRPGVKGREGNIWNTPIAHYGLVDLGHGASYAVPWRAGANETAEALKVYKANYEKYPNQFVTNVGMGRVYSAEGNYKKAIEYLKTALSQSPDNYNKNLVEGMIRKLEEGKNVN